MKEKEVNSIFFGRDVKLKPGYYWANYMEPTGCVYGPDIVEVSIFNGVSDVYALGKRSNINICKIEFLCEITPPVDYECLDPISFFSEQSEPGVPKESNKLRRVKWATQKMNLMPYDD